MLAKISDEVVVTELTEPSAAVVTSTVETRWVLDETSAEVTVVFDVFSEDLVEDDAAALLESSDVLEVVGGADVMVDFDVVVELVVVGVPLDVVVDVDVLVELVVVVVDESDEDVVAEPEEPVPTF